MCIQKDLKFYIFSVIYAYGRKEKLVGSEEGERNRRYVETLENFLRIPGLLVQRGAS